MVQFPYLSVIYSSILINIQTPLLEISKFSRKQKHKQVGKIWKHDVKNSSNSPNHLGPED